MIRAGPVPARDLDELLPEERAFGARLDGERLGEWVAGRICLARSLERLNCGRSPLLPDASGAPQIPAGFAGSISHKSRLALGLAARNSRGIGVDVEFASEGDLKLALRVLTSRERAPLDSLDNATAAQTVATHFSIKEAIFKSLPGAAQTSLDFYDIELSLPLPLPESTQDWLRVPARVCRELFLGEVMVLIDRPWIVAAARLT